VEHLPSRISRLKELDGRTSVLVRGQGTEFDSLREYVRGAEIAIDFDLAVTSLAVDVLALPDAAGAPGSVLLLAFAGASLVAFDVSDPSATGDSGLPEDTLAVAGAGITRALLCAPSPNDPTSCLAPGIPTTLWIDQVRFEPVPEPSTLVLAGIALAAFAVGRRTQ